MTPRTRIVQREPPPLDRAPGVRSFEGTEALEEFPGPLGLILWQSARDVALWGRVGGRGLFSPEAAEARRALLEEAGGEVEPCLHAPLAVCAALLRPPAIVDVGRLVNACRRVAEWAEGRGRLGTAVLFMSAAASAAPADPRPAVAVGRLARLRAEYDRAVTWFRHALVLARQADDHQAKAEAWAGLGNLHIQKGNYPKARECHHRCLRVARKWRLHEMVGSAYHNLLVVAGEAGEYRKAEEYAGLALTAYRAGSPRIIKVAFDLAYLWILEGGFERALSVLREADFEPLGASDRVLGYANLARAAGGAGEAVAFEDAWAEAWALVDQVPDASRSAVALLDLAWGAASLEEWKRAERAAVRAMDLARDRQEHKIALTAESVVDLIRTRNVEQRRAEHDPASDRLARRFVAALRCRETAIGV